jgi:hypothetical protein
MTPRLNAKAWETVGWNTPGSAPVPMFRAHAWALQAAHDRGARFVVTSADRREGVAEAYGKSSQAALYRLYLAGKGYPANPPGRSSHELRSDGNVVYLTPAGDPISRRMLGIDAVDDGCENSCDQLIQTLNALGIRAVKPYASGAEAHHFIIRNVFEGIAWRALVKSTARRHSRRWLQIVTRKGYTK